MSLLSACPPVGGSVTPQLAEVSAVRWVSVDEVAALDDIPEESAGLLSAVARWPSTGD